MNLETPGLNNKGGTLCTKVIRKGIGLTEKKNTKKTLSRNGLKWNKRRVKYKGALPLGGSGGSDTYKSLPIVSVI